MRRGEARRGKARRGKARQGEARRGEARRGAAWRGMATHGKAARQHLAVGWLWLAGLGLVRGHDLTDTYYSLTPHSSYLLLTHSSLLTTCDYLRPRRCLEDMTSYAPPYALRVMTVILGTVASANAYSSLAPCRMIPPCSWAVPGRKPRGGGAGDGAGLGGTGQKA